MNEVEEVSGVQKFFGKYRGRVVNNVDPLMLGRVIVEAPAVSGSPLGWAMPCVPYAGTGVGFYAVPPIGANVWVEFEGGDPNFPIYAGGFWSQGDVPSSVSVGPHQKVFKTETATIAVDDMLGELVAKIVSEAGERKIKLGPEGIQLETAEITLEITNDDITLSCGPSKMQINFEGIRLASGAASANLSAAEINLQVGASSIDMTPAMVDINNGALEVV